MDEAIAVIPCRYGASRFPGKPLAEINGRPMMWHVAQQALKAATISEVYIATDDDRIRKACEVLDLKVLMTSTDHASGTDRVAECARSLRADIIVNVQGDEPMMKPQSIDKVVEALRGCHESVMAANGYHYLSDPTDVVDTNVVKVLSRVDEIALAYSRAPVPYPKSDTVRYKRQLGLYAFRHEGLTLFHQLEPGPLERIEGVEMYRFVENGYLIRLVDVGDDGGIPVDTPADLARVRQLMSTARPEAAVGAPD
jgi:3-deoxy-manno-octulosonate cytidylyltransferase (CMP-KDO synthetase)